MLGCVVLCVLSLSQLIGSLGGHLAFRAAFDKRCLAAQCYFATDMQVRSQVWLLPLTDLSNRHSETLGSPAPSDSLARANEIDGEMTMIFGLFDNVSSLILMLRLYSSRATARTV